MALFFFLHKSYLPLGKILYTLLLRNIEGDNAPISKSKVLVHQHSQPGGLRFLFSTIQSI